MVLGICIIFDWASTERKHFTANIGVPLVLEFYQMILCKGKGKEAGKRRKKGGGKRMETEKGEIRRVSIRQN